MFDLPDPILSPGLQIADLEEASTCMVASFVLGFDRRS